MSHADWLLVARILKWKCSEYECRKYYIILFPLICVLSIMAAWNAIRSCKPWANTNRHTWRHAYLFTATCTLLPWVKSFELCSNGTHFPFDASLCLHRQIAFTLFLRDRYLRDDGNSRRHNSGNDTIRRRNFPVEKHTRNRVYRLLTTVVNKVLCSEQKKKIQMKIYRFCFLSW